MKTVLTKKVEDGRIIIKDGDKVVTNIKSKFCPNRNIRSYLTKNGKDIEFDIVEDAAVVAKVYVTKKDAKAGDLVKLFGADYVAYDANGVIKFKKC